MNLLPLHKYSILVTHIVKHLHRIIYIVELSRSHQFSKSIVPTFRTSQGQAVLTLVDEVWKPFATLLAVISARKSFPFMVFAVVIELNVLPHSGHFSFTSLSL